MYICTEWLHKHLCYIQAIAGPPILPTILPHNSFVACVWFSALQNAHWNFSHFCFALHSVELHNANIWESNIFHFIFELLTQITSPYCRSA